jgi:hypothetical protein
MTRKLTVDADAATVISMLNAMEEHLNSRNCGAEPGSAVVANDKSATKSGSSSGGKSGGHTTQGLAAKGKTTGKRALRRRFSGEVLIVKNKRYVKGLAKNISKSGIFVAASQQVFAEGEAVRVHIKPSGSAKTYRLVARVARFQNNLPSASMGYGLRFIYPQRTLKYS